MRPPGDRDVTQPFARKKVHSRYFFFNGAAGIFAEPAAVNPKRRFVSDDFCGGGIKCAGRNISVHINSFPK